MRGTPTQRAGQIIAGNIFDRGHLTLDRAGEQLVDVSLHSMLTEKAYYFVSYLVCSRSLTSLSTINTLLSPV